MADFTDLLRGIKKAASGTIEADKPVAVIFGTVTSIDPLEITIEQKMMLSGPQLVLTRTVKNKLTGISMSFTTGEALSTHTHPYSDITDVKNIPHTHDMPHTHNYTGSTGNEIPEAEEHHNHAYNGTTDNIPDSTQSADPAHAHDYSGFTDITDLTHSHGNNLTNTKATLYDALEIGDEVILLRMQGGQRFIVIDKL